MRVIPDGITFTVNSTGFTICSYQVLMVHTQFRVTDAEAAQ
jgi:hypothetical protein